MFFKCSRDGRHIILVYTITEKQAVDDPEIYAEEEEKAQDQENLDEEEVN